jgi:hypothetical protein
MSDPFNQDPNEWVPQGFYGPLAVAAAAKIVMDEDPRAGAWVPPKGEPPMEVDTSGATGMFAVMTRRHSPIPKPDGMLEANPAITARLVNM